MAQAEIQTAFTGGEFSPALYGRTDFDKYERGAALLRNFFVDYRGGATNRPGTKFCADITSLVTDPALPPRLLPFIVSTDAGYELVFTDRLISIYLRGVAVTTVVTPYAAADLFQIKYAQSADVMTLTHPSYPPANLSRLSAFVFTYTAIVIGPTIQPPTIVSMRAPHPGPYNYSYLMTAVDLDGKEESLPSNIGVQNSEVLNETTNRVIGLSGGVSPQATLRYNFYKWGPIDAVTMVPATQWGYVGSAAAPTFSDNNIAADFSKQPPQWGDPFSGGQFESIRVLTGGAGYDGVTGGWGAGAIPFVPLNISGDGTGAAGYAVIDHANHVIIAAYMTNPGKNYTHATITANGQGGTGATFAATFSDIEPLNPACVSYLQQRRVFGGSNLKPETLVLSVVGLYNNFDATPAALPTDAIVLSIASLQVNTIKAFVPTNYGLIILTTGGSFLLNGGSPYAPITPETVTVQAQASTGANDLPPLTINYDILYGQNKGNRIHNLAFAWQRQSYTGNDVSTLAAHLFDDHMTVDWCYAEEPFKLVWAVRDDGKLLSMTYVPEQDVFAWARHDTQGLFKSVCSVPEENVNAVYTVVERYVPPISTRAIELTRVGRPTVQFLGSAAGGTLFEARDVIGTIQIGDVVFGPCFSPGGSTVTSQDSGITGGDGNYRADATVTDTGACSMMTATIVGTLMTVETASSLDALEIGSFIFPLPGTSNQNPDSGDQGFYIAALGTGTGGVGTYTLNKAPASPLSPSLTITSQFGWKVPADWNDAINTIDVLGCGGDGGAGEAGLSSGGGGGGSGAYSKRANLTLTPGDYIPYQVGKRGRFNNEYWSGGTWFAATHVDGPSSAWPQGVTGRGGGNGDDTGISDGGLGGAAGRGDTTVIGANGGDGEDLGIGSLPAAGGGGAGAPWTGASAAGTNGSGGNGGAGGDADGGLTTGGAGATSTTSAVPGADGPEVASFGAGSGGGAGSATTGHINGANAGRWGAGGGGTGRSASTIGTPGVGTNGKILIQYTSSIPPTCEGWNFFLERFDNRLTDCLERAWFLDAAVQSPLNAGDGEFKIGAATGTTTLEYCPDEVGHDFAVNDVVIIGCTRIRVTVRTSATLFTVQVIGDLNAYIIPGDPDFRLKLFTAADWEWVTPTNLVTGLDHLEGKEVWTLADGKVDGPRTVTLGAIELAAPAALKTTGLLFQQQIKTLYLTVDGLQPGTIQGKRKMIPAVTLRVDNTLGLKVGLSFDQLTDCIDIQPQTTDVAVTPHVAITGDSYTPVFSDWTETGEVCIQQDFPLPAQVLGVIPQVTPGDTGR